jgi:ferredoxin/flavodoxin---NADP+ reductase
MTATHQLHRNQASPSNAVYNATLVDVAAVHEELRIFRVQPDWDVAAEAGQYLALGLGNWERRVANVQPETDPLQNHKLIRRAYSISCPILDDSDHIRRIQDHRFLEFYITLIRQAKRPPALTPRLFAMEVGARLFAEPHIVGHYTLEAVQADEPVVFFATGTGEAPHNAMLAELLHRGHRGRIVNAVCVRRRRDLGYHRVHRRLEKLFPHYRYLTLTTREPENTDPQRPDFQGKRYLQDFVASGELEASAQLPLDPRHCHVFLCGSPDMIGLSRPGQTSANSRPGMISVLEERGFVQSGPLGPGRIRYERYW